MWDVRSAHIPSSRTQGAPRVFPLGHYTPLVSMEDSFPFIAGMHLPNEVLNQDDLNEGTKFVSNSSCVMELRSSVSASTVDGLAQLTRLLFLDGASDSQEGDWFELRGPSIKFHPLQNAQHLIQEALKNCFIYGEILVVALRRLRP